MHFEFPPKFVHYRNNYTYSCIVFLLEIFAMFFSKIKRICV